MSNNQFWNDKFTADAQRQQDSGNGPIFAGDANATIAELIAPLKPGKAIDLGSGRGRHVVWLAKQGWDTTALDFSEVGLEHTKQALDAEGLAATLLHEDLTSWSPEPESYDLVLCSFIHLPPQQQRALWRKIADALTPGGHVVSVSHHPDNQVHGPGNPDLLYAEDDLLNAFEAFEDEFVVVTAERNVVAEVDDKQAVDTVVKLRKQ